MVAEALAADAYFNFNWRHLERTHAPSVGPGKAFLIFYQVVRPTPVGEESTFAYSFADMERVNAGFIEGSLKQSSSSTTTSTSTSNSKPYDSFT